MNNPLVSILIPVYNAENYVAEAIESALNQTYKNIEIIIVDDGSTDKSWEIIESYRKKYPNIIKTYQQENKGACAARNKAFELSSGQYIQYLDADDLLAENKIEEQTILFKKFGNNNKIITSCSWVRFKNNPKDAKIDRQYIDKDYDNPIDWLIDSWRGKGMGQTNIWLIPRDIIDAVGKWNEQLKKNQDGEFFCRVLLKSNKIIYSNNSIVYYRDTENSITNIFSYETSEHTLKSYELYCDYLSRYLDQKKVRLALATNFSSFYSYVYPHYPDLLARAEKKINELGFKSFPLNGGRNFKLLSSLIGVKKATHFRSIFNKSILKK